MLCGMKKTRRTDQEKQNICEEKQVIAIIIRYVYDDAATYQASYQHLLIIR